MCGTECLEWEGGANKRSNTSRGVTWVKRATFLLVFEEGDKYLKDKGGLQAQSAMAAAMGLNLSTWTGVVPVVLPWGEPTLSVVGVASAGVALPFFFYVVAMFMLIVPIWMNNFESDQQRGGSSSSSKSVMMVGMDPSQFTSLTIQDERMVSGGGDYGAYLVPEVVSRSRLAW